MLNHLFKDLLSIFQVIHYVSPQLALKTQLYRKLESLTHVNELHSLKLSDVSIKHYISINNDNRDNHLPKSDFQSKSFNAYHPQTRNKPNSTNLQNTQI